MGTHMKKLMKLKHTNKRVAKMMSLSFILLMIFTIILTSIPFDNIAYANDDGDGGVSNLSLYNRSSELAREFGTSLAPGTEQDFTKMISNANAGTAGGLLGYADIMSDDDAVVGWLTSSFTTASVQLTYDQLENITGSKEDNPFYAYAGYGEALNAMGLSKTVRGDSGKIGRQIATGYIMFLYLVSLAISMLFSLAMKVIVLLNPFKLFMGVFGNVADLDLGILSAAAAQVELIYKAIQDIALFVLLPMFLVITVFTVLVFAKGQALKRFSRYALRVFMIFAGLPLIGATYTGIIEDLEESISTGSMVSEYLIYSSYVDFENWVKETRLGAPREGYASGSESIRHPRFVAEGSDSIDKMHNPSRTFILGLNAKQAGNAKAYDIYTQFKDGGLAGALGSQGELEYKDAADIKIGTSGLYSKQTAMDLLRRHFNNDKYSGSHYDGEVTGQVQKLLDGTTLDDDGNATNTELSANDTEILRMFTLTASKNRTWQKSTDLKIKPHPDDPGDKKVQWWKEPVKFHASAHLLNPNEISANAFDFSHYPAHIYNNGALELKKFSDDKGDEGSGYVFRSYSLEDGAVDDGVPLNPDGTITGGLSPLAMYNFLNTTFSDSGLTIWSSDKSSSDQTRDSYAAVVHGGTGVTSVLRWMETATLMTSMNVLTIAFSIMMIQVAITGIPRILSGVFGTALGSIASITKLLVSTGVMLLQFLGMMFMYYLSENIIVGMMIQIDRFVGGTVDEFDTSSIMLFNGSIGGPLDSITLVSGNVIIDVFKSIMMIIVVAGVTYFMIKNIGTLRNILEELVTDGIQRLMSGLDTSTGGKGHGLKLSDVSGGRIDNKDGKLTDEAKHPNLSNLPIGGKMAEGLKGAHDLASMREAQLEAQGVSADEIYGEGASAGGIKGALAKAKGKARNRFSKGGLGQEGKESLAKRMTKAARQDGRTNAMMKPLFGIEGKQLQRAMGAEQKDIDRTGRARTYDNHGKKSTDVGDNTNNKLEDINSRLPQNNESLMFNDKGELLDTNGDVYTDENGTPLMQNSEGHLVDDNGNYMQIGEDGVLEPSDEPKLLADEAQKLDTMRSDADAKQAMLEAQDDTHYGIDADGNVVNADNEPIKTKDGLDVSLDAEGRMIDSNGDFVQPSDLDEKDLDMQGFEVKTDEDGNQYLQHKGDDALREGAKVENDDGEMVNTIGDDGKSYSMRKADVGKSVTAMAKEANNLENRAKRAREKVNRLKANGASPYAIQQAERHANRLINQANDAQNRYNNHIASGAGRTGERVSKDHVETAKRSVQGEKQNVQKTQENLKNEQQKLQELQQANKPINDQRQVVQEAQQAQQKAEQQVDTARQAVQTAQQEQQQAFAQYTANPTSQTKQAYDNAVAKTNSAKQNYSQAQQSVQQAKQTVQQSQQKLGQMEQQNQASVRAQNQQERRVEQAQKQHQQARRNYTQANNSAKYTNMAYQTNRSYGEVEQAHVQQRQAEQGYQQAYQEYVQAEASGDTARIQQAQQNMNRQANQFTQANANVQRVSQQPQGTTAQIDKSNAEVMRLQNAYQNATSDKQRTQIGKQLRREKRRLNNLQSPRGWYGSQQIQQQVLSGSNTNQNHARQYMKTQGITSYNDYANQIKNEQANINEKRAELQRINSMLNSPLPMSASKRNEMAERRGVLRREINNSNQRMNDLRQHASGMLDSKGFTPTIASRPIKQHGGQVVTQLSNLSGMQKMYESLKFRQDNGTLDSSGEAQLIDLDSRMGHLRRELIGLGIQEEYLSNQSTIQKSIGDVQRSWISYINGELRES